MERAQSDTYSSMFNKSDNVKVVKTFDKKGCLCTFLRIGIPRELSEIRTQPWLSEGSLTSDSCHHSGPIF